MVQHWPGHDRKGKISLRKVYNRDARVWEKYDGHEGHSDMETVFKVVASAGTAFFTLASTQRAYITFCRAQVRVGSKSVATVHFVASGVTPATMMIVRLLGMTSGAATGRVGLQQFIQGDGKTPWIEIAAGKTFVVKSRPNALTSSVTISFYRVLVTGNK